MKISFLLLCIVSGCSNLLLAQDTIFTIHGVLPNVKIRDNQRTFIEYRLPDDEKMKNNFIQKKDLLSIVREGGLHEVIVKFSTDSIQSVYYLVNEHGDTNWVDKNYDPTGIRDLDPTVKLCHLKDRTGLPHFYINDPERKFFNCHELIYLGADFSCMKLVNRWEIGRGALIKNKYLRAISEDLNTSNAKVQFFSLGNKKIIYDVAQCAQSYATLNEYSWITDEEYALDAHKIPAIIKSRNFSKQEGIAVVFIVERFSKQALSISGYWVAFELATKNTLLIDHVVYNQVGKDLSSAGWKNYWERNLFNAGAYNAAAFDNYLMLEKKGKFELICD